jgi:hypothetical protein
MTRPRAADDFAVIRARLEELRRERERAPAPEVRPLSPRPYHAPSVVTPNADPRRSRPVMGQKLFW